MSQKKELQDSSMAGNDLLPRRLRKLTNESANLALRVSIEVLP